MGALREKLPELVLEGGMVVFAVIVALGVDEWRESRQNAELAERALAGIAAEIESNRRELVENGEANQALLTRVREAARDSVLPDDFNVTFEYSLISASAWETAQVTRATQFIPLDRVQTLAKLYGLQALYQASQDKVMDFILSVGDLADREPERIPRLILGPLVSSVGMGELLTQVYDTTLARLEDGEGGGG
ncbi:MAG: hypothetical protein ACWGSQ_05845 [Longimicrobiales bacterium]